jgi:shikimate dehydrogenase
VSDRYAVIGNPVEHSKSPWIHAHFARQTGESIEYGRLLSPLGEFAQTVQAFRAAGGSGANVTLPFKEEAFRLCGRVTDRARSAEAVNTLSFNGDRIEGENTDGCGLTRDLVNNLGFPIAGRRVLLLGAGGAARGVLLPLMGERPALLVIANRDLEKARLLARRFDGVSASAYQDLAGERFDLVINATSAGLAQAALPLPPRIFAEGSLAYEMVYGRDTDFMLQACANGAAATADGLGMLVEQAAESFYTWRGVRPETASVLAALRAT